MLHANFSSIVQSIGALVLVIVFFGGSIFVHELGHFLAARKRGLKVERFSIGFGPKIISWKRAGVQYCISAFPFGGYVALPQLGDMQAIEGKYDNKADPNATTVTYLDKVIVLVMGAVFNVLFATAIATVLWKIGIPVLAEDETTVIGYVQKTISIDRYTEVPGPAYVAGLQAGDRVLAIDGIAVQNFSDIQKLLVTGMGRSTNGEAQAQFSIERKGHKREVTVAPVLVEANANSGDRMRLVGILASGPIIVQDVLPDSPADQAGLKAGDQILSVEGIPVLCLMALSDYLNSNNAATAHIKILRQGTPLNLTLTAQKAAYSYPLARITPLESKNVYIECLPKFATAVDPSEAMAHPLTDLVIFDIHAPEGGISALKKIQLGDSIRKVQDQPFSTLDQFIQLVNARTYQTQLELGVGSEESLSHVTLPASFRAQMQAPLEQTLLGFSRKLEKDIAHPSPWRQISESLSMTWRVLMSVISRSSDVGIQNLMGPPGIIRTLHAFSMEDVRLVLAFTVLLNINLAVLNLLPIPVLDGGHILFATIARLRGRPLGRLFIAKIQGAFMFMLFALMLYVSFFDIRRWQGDNTMQKRLELDRAYIVSPKFKN